MQQPAKSRTQDAVRTIAAVLLGDTLYAVGVTAFVVQGGIITGGTTGIALIFNWLWEVPIPVFTGIFNIAVFLLGLFILGKRFAVTTVVSTFYIPIILGVCQELPFLKNITDDKMLCVVYAGLLIGCGLGIVLRTGASTGGMDIPPLILNKLFKIPVAAGIYAFDFIILLAQMLLSEREQVLYGILLLFIYSTVLDRVLRPKEKQKQNTQKEAEA